MISDCGFIPTGDATDTTYIKPTYDIISLEINPPKLSERLEGLQSLIYRTK
jgi:hypothetical protein